MLKILPFLALLSSSLIAQEELGDLHEIVAASGFQGSVRVERAGETLLRKGYGLADREHQVANTPQTRFRIGSLTKSFAGVAVTLLEERGQLSAGDRIAAHLEAAPPAWDAVTIADLLHHRSGIPNLEGMPSFRERITRPSRPRQTMEVFSALPLNRPPDTRFEYSSSGYVVLASVIEQVSGQTWEEFLAGEILAKLSMAHTRSDDPARLVPHRARGYRQNEGPVQNAMYMHPSVAIGGGDLLSTVDDLVRWIDVLRTDAVLSKESRERVLTPEPIRGQQGQQVAARSALVNVRDVGGYARGWFVGRQSGERIVVHTGGIHGFSSYLAWFPDQDLTIVLLSNDQEGVPMLRTALSLGRAVLGGD